MQTGHKSAGQDTSGLDVRKPVVAHNEAVVAILIATTQYLVLTVGSDLSQRQRL